MTPAFLLLTLTALFAANWFIIAAMIRLSRERDRQDVEAIRHAQAQTEQTGATS